MSATKSPVSPREPVVLLVEDEPKVLERVRDMLEAKHYSVITADSPDQAFRVIQSSGHIDLLLTDVLLPRMDGCALSERLKTIQPDLKTLFMSGFLEENLTKYHGLILDGRPFLRKPFSGEMLDERVRQVLEDRV